MGKSRNIKLVSIPGETAVGSLAATATGELGVGPQWLPHSNWTWQKSSSRQRTNIFKTLAGSQSSSEKKPWGKSRLPVANAYTELVYSSLVIDLFEMFLCSRQLRLRKWLLWQNQGNKFFHIFGHNIYLQWQTRNCGFIILSKISI